MKFTETEVNMPNINIKTMMTSHTRPELLLRAKYKNDSKKYVLPRRASLTDLRRIISDGFNIPAEEVKISTSVNHASTWKPLTVDGATLVADIFSHQDQMLVEREEKLSEQLQIIMRRLQKQQEEYESKIRRWQADEDGEFCVASFADWKLNPGSWGFEILDFLWPDEAEIDSQLSKYTTKRDQERAMQKLRNEIMFEIKVFEALENKYKTATSVTDIVTCYFQLSASMNFKTCNGIATMIAGFCGADEYIKTLPENEMVLATFWNNVCTNPSLLNKTYNSSSAEALAESLTRMCVVDTKSELKISQLAFVLRKKFPGESTPICGLGEERTKTLDKLQEWDKAILQWFVDHNFLPETLETGSVTLFGLTRTVSPKCDLRLLEAEAETEKGEL